MKPVLRNILLMSSVTLIILSLLSFLVKIPGIQGILLIAGLISLAIAVRGFQKLMVRSEE